MQSLQEILLQKKIKEIRFKAIAGIVCAFLSIIPYLGFLFALASLILFFIVLYDLKIYGGAKKLFINFFIGVGINFFSGIISLIAVFMILEPHISYSRIYFDEDNIFLAIVVFLVLHIITMALNFPFIKAFYYEIARVTKQKYFINVFWAYFIGLCTLFIGVGLVAFIVGFIFWILAWVEFKELDKQEFSNEEENLNRQEISNKAKFTIPAQKVIFNFDLKWIKITMVLSLILSAIAFGVINFAKMLLIQPMYFDFMNYYEPEARQDLLQNLLTIRPFLFYLAIILALLSVFLFCKKLKTYKIFIYFFVWQALVVLESNLYSISKLIMSENIFFANNIFEIIISIVCIIIAFLFFRTLVQVTKEKLFYLVFAFFTCEKIAIFVKWIIFKITGLESPVSIITTYINIPFLIAYLISFLIFWLKLKGQKEVKKVL